MKSSRYPAEFKAEAVRQVIEQGHGVVEVSQRLGMSDKSLYLWVRQAKDRGPTPVTGDVATLRSEVTRLKVELKRTTEERDILKKAAAYFAKVSE
jgi:transposase